MLVSNFLESKDQSKSSKFGGEMMSSSQSIKSNQFFKNDLMNNLARNFTYFAAPLFCTSMIGTITYPLAVRFVKKAFRLRNFYSIHIAIAPFLALIHINFFALVQTLINVQYINHEYREVKPNYIKEYEDIKNCRLQSAPPLGAEPFGYNFYRI